MLLPDHFVRPQLCQRAALEVSPRVQLLELHINDLVNVLHLWKFESLLSHPRCSLDRSCQRRRSDRLFLVLEGGSCSGLPRPTRRNASSCTPLSHH